MPKLLETDRQTIKEAKDAVVALGMIFMMKDCPDLGAKYNNLADRLNEILTRLRSKRKD